MNTVRPPEETPDALPVAEIRARSSLFSTSIYRWWWLPAACLLLALLLFAIAWGKRGTSIVVQFEQGHGIQPGDRLRHRGIEVGEVTRVELTEQLDGVLVHLRLDAPARSLARQGSRFWIVRPEISLSRIRGLDTVIGPKYIAVAPGPASAPSQHVFKGDEVPVGFADGEDQEIRIHFGSGHGLAVGDELRHRGIVIGEVTSVQLQPNGSGVTVNVRLATSAADVARAGSQFWIERPRINVTGIGGLDTLVGGRYLAVLPGPADAPPHDEFQGLDVAPVAIDRAEGGLEIVLESAHRQGVDSGAPLTYRGIEVGKILGVQLSGDAATVEARAYVYPAYRTLIRENTRFWSTSGVDLRVGVSGIRFTADTLATVIAGGVALATPPEPGDPVATGHRFQLEHSPDDVQEWLQWQPRLALGDSRLPGGAELPRALRGLLRWERRTLGIRRTRQREGWYLVLANQLVLAPADLLSVPEEAVEQQATLELAGFDLRLRPEQVERAGRLARIDVSARTDTRLPADWPLEALRVADDVEDCLIVTAFRDGSVPLPASRLTERANAWEVDPAVPLDADVHGAPVVAMRDGALIGLVVVEPKGRYVALITSTLIP